MRKAQSLWNGFCAFCNGDKPKSGLARDLGDRLHSRNVPFGTSGDLMILNGIIISDIRVSFLCVKGGARMVVKTIFEY